MSTTPRFIALRLYGGWHVLDTQPPEGDPLVAEKFGTFENKAQAVMVAMSLNGQK